MKWLEEFKKFVLRGNIVDLAIGFTVGAAFSTVAKSLVNDIIMPPIGLLLGGMDFSDLFVVLKQGSAELPPYSTLKDAQSSGAVTLNYGIFVNNLIALLIVAIAMFLLIRVMNRIHDTLDDQFGEEQEGPQTPASKKCPFCREAIDFKATRCRYCTSTLSDDAKPASGTSS